MPKGCCGGNGTCACKVEAGRLIAVSGAGSSQDPIVIGADLALSSEDTQTFDVGISGDGTLAAPWIVRVVFASTARWTDLPDIDAPNPNDGDVAHYSVAAGKWVTGPPNAATPGAIFHDTSVNGDGSASAPLGVKADGARFLTVTTTGVGISNTGLAQMVRTFADEATRDADTIPPALNSISLLASEPGRIDYWDGTEWQPALNGIGSDIQTGQLLTLSGAYAGGPLVQYVAQLSDTTDVDGLVELVPADDLATYAGVLSAKVTPTGSGTAWVPMVDTDTDRIVATAVRVDDGSPLAASPVTGVVEALLY